MGERKFDLFVYLRVKSMFLSNTLYNYIYIYTLKNEILVYELTILIQYLC